MTNLSNDVAPGEAEIIRAFSQANAMSANTAKSLDDLAITQDAAFRSLLSKGIVCRSPSDPGKFYTLPHTSSLFVSREHRGTVIAALRAVIAIAIALFVWRIIVMLP